MRAREACGAGEGFLMLGELGLNADGKGPVEKAPLEMQELREGKVQEGLWDPEST